MYKIDKDSNRISPLDVQRFSDLNFGERRHLQEWIANEPNVFGEKLLVIQKEFAGFDDTNERLDLLALDKDGGLVVIENKLDDSGRDVVWQAIKYASYCSSLSKSQIVDIYQEYMDRHCNGGSAKQEIREFLDTTELDEVVLNSGNGQRVVLVAANFRKEVTSTVLWLLSHGVQVQCFKVTPYSLAEELFLKVDQIIPTPEAKDLMVEISAKDAEKKDIEHLSKRRHQIRFRFWEQALVTMQGSECDLFDDRNPWEHSWMSAGSGVRACPYLLLFGKELARVKFKMSRSEAKENKFIYDELFKRKAEIEQTFGHALEWKRGNNQISSYIQYSEAFDGYNNDNWPAIIEWMIENISRLESALKTPLAGINSQLRMSPHDAEET